MKRFLLSLFLIVFLAVHSYAQVNGTVEMADALRSSGKIYVVVAVIAVVFVGIAVYLFVIDRKLTKLEGKLSAQKKNRISLN